MHLQGFSPRMSPTTLAGATAADCSGVSRERSFHGGASAGEEQMLFTADAQPLSTHMENELESCSVHVLHSCSRGKHFYADVNKEESRKPQK